MASLNLGQDVANKIERKLTAAHIVAKSYPLYLAVKMRRYGSLIRINPSYHHTCYIHWGFFSILYGVYFCAKRKQTSLTNLKWPTRTGP